MARKTRVGTILIIIGLFIPSVLYPFTLKTRSALLMHYAVLQRGGTYKPSLDELEIVIKKGRWIGKDEFEGHYENRIAIPYHFVLAGGITIFFIGVCFIALSVKPKQ
jgi:hypothetical protein